MMHANCVCRDSIIPGIMGQSPVFMPDLHPTGLIAGPAGDDTEPELSETEAQIALRMVLANALQIDGLPDSRRDAIWRELAALDRQGEPRQPRPLKAIIADADRDLCRCSRIPYPHERHRPADELARLVTRWVRGSTAAESVTENLD